MITKTIDKEKCTSCMKCEKICTNSKVITKAEDGFPSFANNLACIYCGHCFAICPEHAISFNFPEDRSEGLLEIAKGREIAYENGIPAPETIENFLFSIRSDRLFSDKQVEKAKVEKIIEAMMRASTAGNEQNKNYYVFLDKEKIAEIEKLTKDYYQKVLQKFSNPISLRLAAFFESQNNKSKEVPFRTLYKQYLKILSSGSLLDNSEVSYLKNAKALVLMTYNNKSGMHKSFYKSDIRLTGLYGILMAKALGLASCWMGLLEIAMGKEKMIAEYMNIGRKEKVGGALIFGYSDTKWVSYPPRGPAKIIWQ